MDHANWDARHHTIGRERWWVKWCALVVAGLAACDAQYATRGKIVRPDGAPVSGVTVSMRPACESTKAIRSSVSQEDGSYWVGFMGGLWPGHSPTYAIEFAKEGYERRCVERRLPEQSIEDLQIELRPAVVQ